MNELETQLAALKTQLQEYFTKAAEQQTATGTMTADLKTKIEALQRQADALDVKLAERHAAAQPEETLEEMLTKHEGVQKLLKDKRGNCVLNFNAKQIKMLRQYKDTITSDAVGRMVTGVLPIERIPGIVQEARQTLFIRDLLFQRPTVNQVIDFVKVVTHPSIGSPQTEGNDKGQNQATFASASERVQTIATWIPASRQVLDDMSELLSYLQTSLPYYVDLEEEQQLLSGDGNGTNLHGLITQATAFNTSLLHAVDGWNKIDIIGRAVQQIVTAKELEPTFVAMSPIDWWDIRLTKDKFGRYILGDPMEPLAVQFGGVIKSPKNIFGLTPVPTTNMSSGNFLVGSGNPIASEIRDRMEMQVEIATQHADFFAKNLIAIRAEKRLALVVKRPNSYIDGTFTTSP